MRGLWFKARFVAPILSGDKRDTIRARRPWFGAGDIVSASVGPVRPFALLEIVSVAEADVAALDDDVRVALLALYPDIQSAWRVAFRVIERVA